MGPLGHLVLCDAMASYKFRSADSFTTRTIVLHRHELGAVSDPEGCGYMHITNGSANTAINTTKTERRRAIAYAFECLIIQKAVSACYDDRHHGSAHRNCDIQGTLVKQ